MTTLSSLLKASINEQLKKTSPEVFDPELPDYILICLKNRKPKKEMIKELEVFLPPQQTRTLVDWLFNEIELLKNKRKVPGKGSTPKKTEKVRKDKKVKKSKKSKRQESPIELSSDNELEPPPLIRGRRERIQSRDD